MNRLTTDKDADYPLIGEIIAGRYEILEPIGKGGFGCVYKAKHLQVKNIIAIKVLRAEYVEDKQIAARFQNEAKIAGRINNPHITNAFDYGICDQTKVLFIAMEYVPGPSLKELITKKNELDLATSLHILIQLCEGIAAAHAKNILHRDIKPSNIILTDYDNHSNFVKITDFGISTVLLESEELKRLTNTETANPKGTCLYMAPEQFKTGYKPALPLDIYSIGCVLFEVLTGKAPFNGGSDVVTAHLHATARIPDLTLDSVDPVIRSWLANILSKALAKDPSMRYQHVLNLRNDLELVKLRLVQLNLGKANVLSLALERLYLFLCQKKGELQSLFNLSDKAAKIYLLAAAAGIVAVLITGVWLFFRPIQYAFGSVPNISLRKMALEPLIIPHKQELFDSQADNNKVLRFMKRNMMTLLDRGDISTCLERAKRCFSLGEYEKAAEYCQAGEDVCLKDDVNTIAYFDEVVEVCIIHAESCLRLKQYTPARDYATYIVGHLGKADKYNGYEALIAFGIRAEANYQAGLIKAASNDYEEVMKRYTPANVFSHAKDIQFVYTLSRAGKFYEEQNNGNANKSVLLLKAALTSWREYLRKDPENKTLQFNTIVVQNDLGLAEAENQDYDSAHQCFELAKDDMIRAQGDSGINYAKILFNNSDSLWALKFWYGALEERSNGRAIWLRFYSTTSK